MIIRQTEIYPIRVISYMSDAAILAASIKTGLLDVAKQAAALGTGLQNAAPGTKAGAPNNSVSYLLAVSDSLSKLAQECGKIQSAPTSESN